MFLSENEIMRPANMHIPKDVQETLILLSWILLNSPKFLDKTGRFPFRNLNYVFQQLQEGLGNIRPTLGDERFEQLTQLSDQIRLHFEADPENKTGETRKGRDIIYEMEKILKRVPRNS